METDGLALPKGYRDLMKAVFVQACADYAKEFGHFKRRDDFLPAVKARALAVDWFLNAQDTRWPFCLDNVCEVIGYDVKRVRGSIREREKAKEIVP